MKKSPEGRQLILSLIVVLMYFMGCDNPFDDGPSSQPDFEAVLRALMISRVCL